MAFSVEEVKLRLLSRRIITNTGCWEYNGYTDASTGYCYMTAGGQKEAVHKVSFKIFKQSEFEGFKNINHLCNNRRCFNPEHLYNGTQSANMKDAVIKGSHVQACKTHCPKGHEYTKENTWYEKNGARRCKTCINIKNMFYRTLHQIQK